MDNPTIPNYMPAKAAPAVARNARRRAQPNRHGATLGAIWLVANLAALGAVTTVAVSASGLMIAWASFILLNAALYAAVRTGIARDADLENSSAFNTGVGAALGLGWGAGVALLLPFAGGSGLAVLMSTAFALALVAIAVFDEQRAAFIYFLTTFSTLAIAGLLSDGRYPALALWVVIGSAALLMIATVYHRSHQHLRAVVATLLEATNTVTGESAPQRLTADNLATVAKGKALALQQLRRANDRNRRLLRAVGDAVVATDTHGSIDYLNPVAEVLLGWTLKELKGLPIEVGMKIVVPPDHGNQARDVFEQTRLTRRAQYGDEHCQLVRRDGAVYGIEYMVTPVKNGAGAFLGAMYLIRDVTEKRHRAETIAWQATHDALTGAINRTEFEARLKKLVQHTPRESANVHALLFIDVDNFKFINDSYGHAAGDAALKTLADVLRTRIRGADTLGRVGGDEFSALLYRCSGEKARLIGESVRVAVERHEFRWQSIDLPISLSIGIVEINDQCKSIAEIVRAADSACYAAKRSGRNRVRVFDPDRDGSRVQTRVFDFVKDIQAAIHGNHIEMFYRPLHGTRAEQGGPYCELSVAIRDSDGELVPRLELAELARRYHLSEEIDRWSIKATIDALQLKHPALRDMALVLVPISLQSINDERLLDYITAQLEDNAGVGDRLGFAFEEADLAGNREYIRYFVSTLKQFGCRFMVSDVGFGSQAVELLKSVHADFLGIRGGLVRNMLHSTVDYEVVLGLSRIAQALDMRTVAADADTGALRDALTKMGIDYTCGQLLDQPRALALGAKP